MSQKTQYPLKKRKKPNKFLHQKVHNWNKNFTRQLQWEDLSQQKNQIMWKIGQLKLSVWSRKRKKENYRESNLNFDLKLSSWILLSSLSLGSVERPWGQSIPRWEQKLSSQAIRTIPETARHLSVKDSQIVINLTFTAYLHVPTHLTAHFSYINLEVFLPFWRQSLRR